MARRIIKAYKTAYELGRFERFKRELEKFYNTERLDLIPPIFMYGLWINFTKGIWDD